MNEVFFFSIDSGTEEHIRRVDGDEKFQERLGVVRRLCRKI